MASQSQILYDAKVGSNDPGHMTKVSAMPIYGKNILLNTKITLKLAMHMQNQKLEYYQVCSNDDSGLTYSVAFFMARSNLVPNTLSIFVARSFVCWCFCKGECSFSTFIEFSGEQCKTGVLLAQALGHLDC